MLHSRLALRAWGVLMLAASAGLLLQNGGGVTVTTELRADEPPLQSDHLQIQVRRISDAGDVEAYQAPGMGPYRELAIPRQEPHRFDGINQVEFSSDSKSLFVAAHRVGELGVLGRKPTSYWIEQWDVAEWKQLAMLQDLAAPLATTDDRETIAALSASDALDGPPFGRIGQIVIYDLRRQAISRRFGVDAGYVCGLACSPDGRSLVTCSREDARDPYRWINGRVVAWNFDGRPIWQHRWDAGRFSVVDWSPRRNLIFGGGSEGVMAWDSEAGNVIWQHNDHPNSIESLASSPDGSLLISASYCDPSLGIGLMGQLHSVVKIRNADNGTPIRTVKLHHAGAARPLDLAASPDGRSIAVALGNYNRGQKWGEVRIVDLKTGDTVATLLKNHPEPVTSVAYSADGRLIALGTADGLVKVYEIQCVEESAASSALAEAIGEVLLGDDFLSGLGQAVGEAIERDLREKLEFTSEMEWKLLGHADDLLERMKADEQHIIVLIHLMLPSDQAQESKTIVLNTSDDPVPFLRLTRSYGLVTRPTAILQAAGRQAEESRPKALEVILTWHEDRWVELTKDTVSRTIQ